MLICYLDESGNTGLRLDDPDQPIHVIAAILVREDRVRIMVDRLDSLAAAAPTTTPLVEYRGQELFSGTGPWAGVEPRQRVREYEKALSVLGEVDAAVAHTSINKTRLVAKVHNTSPNPHLYALQFLTEEIQVWVAKHSHPLSQRVILVADENHEQEQHAMDFIRNMQSTSRPIDNQARSSIRLDNYVDSVYFARSDRNRGIQIADLVAFVIHRALWIINRPSDPRSDGAIIALLEKHIRPQICASTALWPPEEE